MSAGNPVERFDAIIMDRSWLFHWKKLFNFILVQGLLIATGVKQRAQQPHLSTSYRMWVGCHLRSAVGPLASADHAGIVVGHASQTGAAVGRSYSDCRRAPYSCKVQTARLQCCAGALCWQPTCDAIIRCTSVTPHSQAYCCHLSGLRQGAQHLLPVEVHIHEERVCDRCLAASRVCTPAW